MPLPKQLSLDHLNLSDYEAVALHGSYVRDDYFDHSDVDIAASGWRMICLFRLPV